MIHIVIPSHKRPRNVITKRLIDSPIICVPQSQGDDYERSNPGCEIITHPDEVVGLAAKRQWIVDKFGEVFMLDDDVQYFRRAYECKGEKSIMPLHSLKKQIILLYELAKSLDIKLFGFGRIARPNYYDEFKPFTLLGVVQGCGMGVIKDKRLRFNTDIKTKEDEWIAGLCMHFNRKVLIDNRYMLVTPNKMFKTKGGLAEFRNTKTHEDDMLNLRRHFGEAVCIKSTTDKRKKGKIERNTYMRFFNG